MNNPRNIEEGLDLLRPGWRERRDKKKSPWNFVCLLIGFGMAGIFMNYLCQAALWLHLRFYPAHEALRKDLWHFLNATSSPSALLMALPLFVPAIVAGFLMGNVIMWVIPPARHAMNAEAAGDREMTFAGSNAGLLKFGGLTSALCFVLSLIGIFTLKSLK